VLLPVHGGMPLSPFGQLAKMKPTAYYSQDLREYTAPNLKDGTP
jgi:hypothetical protein